MKKKTKLKEKQRMNDENAVKPRTGLQPLNILLGHILVGLGRVMVADGEITLTDMRNLYRELGQAKELCRRAIEARQEEMAEMKEDF